MSTPTFSVRIAGTDTRFASAPGDNLLRAGLRTGLGLPHECNAGGCGACKFELLSGQVRELWPEAPGLSAKDRSRGRRLACQCQVLSDCEIKIRTGAEFVPALKPLDFQAEYLGSQPVTADIREFRFRGPAPARFVPGQYAMVTLPGLDQPRAYSMSNQPNEAGDWHFMVRRLPQGRASALLFDVLKPGDQVAIDGPLGLAHWRAKPGRDVVCIAGGSGLAPMLSIANAVSAGVGAPAKLWFFYGGRGPADIPDFDRQLTAPERVLLHTSVSGPPATLDAAAPDGWAGERGFVHELLQRRLTRPPQDCEFYLAGPPPMIEILVRGLMLERQVPAAQIHYDRFF
jgi:toluene monooxygenase electron transfer component